MISVIIPTSNSIRDLEPLMASLVAGAVDGLVREVILADAGSSDETADLAEDAGATMLQGDLAAAAQAAKNERILVVPSDLRLPYEWVQKLSAHLTTGGGDALLKGTWRGPRWLGPHIGAAAMLIGRGQVIANGAGGLAGLRRRLKSPTTIR